MMGSNCQSCGMPMKQDKAGGGTNADGSKNLEFCSFCYQNGEYTEPNITLDQMTERVKGKLKEMHIPGIMANMMVKGVPNLKRWSN